MFSSRADRVSMSALFPKLLEIERGESSIARGVIKRAMAGGKMPGRRLISWRDGVGALPRALGKMLGTAVKTGVVARRLRAVSGGFRVDLGTAGSVVARAAVLATQPHVAATLLADIDPSAAAAAGAIEAPPLATVFLGYRRDRVDHPLDGFGYLSTVGNGDRALNGAQFCSTMFAARAPAGHVALAAYIGGDRAPHLAELPARDLIALARAEFKDLLGVTGEPIVARARQWPRGLPQYRLGHADRLADLQSVGCRMPGLFITGNYLTGPSIGVCVANARLTAAAVSAHLGEAAIGSLARHHDTG
jgi:oxygen-dependent protoporphyrinogen oxidase